MTFDKPKLLYKFEVERKQHIRRFMWMLLAFVASFSAWIALDYVGGQGDDIDPDLLRFGQSIAIVLAIILFFRAVIHLLRAIRTKSESAQFFDRGFRWKIGKNDPAKYSWSQLRSFRQGVRTVAIFKRPIFQFGEQVITMRDGKSFKFTARHGDIRQFTRAVRPYIADITGTQMGRQLRENKAVRLHPDLAISPNGVIAGKHKIRWSQVDIKATKNKLVISKRTKKGQFKAVKSYNIRQIDNIAGFLDIAHSTIQNHQPERFNIKTYEATA